MVSCTAIRTELKTVSISIKDNCNTSDIIFSSPSEVQLSFNISSLLTNTNFNNYSILETYDKSILIKDFSNKKIEISTNSLTDRNYKDPILALLRYLTQHYTIINFFII